MIIPHIELARKIIKRINADAPIAYSTLEARAIEKGIELSLFEQAMTIVNKTKTIESKVKGDDIIYTIKVIKLPTVHTGLAWVTHNYPWPENFEMPFPEIDMSYIFLTPEELEKYKAEARGRVYIPSKRYQKKQPTLI